MVDASIPKHLRGQAVRRQDSDYSGSQIGSVQSKQRQAIKSREAKSQV